MKLKKSFNLTITINWKNLIYYIVNLVSAVLLVSEIGAEWKSYVLVFLSLLMLPNPISFLPVLFVSSWSFTIMVIPGFAAFFYYLALFFVSIAISKKRLKSRVPASVETVIALLFAVWIFVMGFKSVSGDWYMPMKLALCILPLFLCSGLRLEKMKYCVVSINIIAVVLSLYLLYTALFAPITFISPNAEELDFALMEETNTLISSDINPNTASLFVFLLYIVLYCEVFRTKRYWLLLFVAPNLITMMYLGSRTAFFAVGIITIVYPLVVLKTKVWKKVVLSVCFVLLFYGVFTMGGDRFERAERLSVSTVIDDEGSGRFTNWYWLSKEIIPYHWLKGIGVGLENYEMYRFDVDADNMYIDVLCQTGVIGLVLFMSFYILLLVNFFRKRKQNRDFDFLIAIFLAFLVEGLGESVFDTPMFWFIGLLSVLAINSFKEPKKRKVLNYQFLSETE